MNAAAIVQLLRTHRLRVFTTADFLTLTGMAADAATHALRRLLARDLLVRVKRGVWVVRLGAEVSPYEAVPFLRAPWPAYVSLYSALSDPGVVEEIPYVVYAVSPALPKRYQTRLGDFHFHHLPSRLIWGFEQRQAGEGTYPIAEPEKAFLDLAYLALTPRSALELPRKRGRRWQLNGEKVRRHTKRFDFEPLSRWIAAERFE